MVDRGNMLHQGAYHFVESLLHEMELQVYLGTIFNAAGPEGLQYRTVIYLLLLKPSTLRCE